MGFCWPTFQNSFFCDARIQLSLYFNAMQLICLRESSPKIIFIHMTNWGFFLRHGHFPDLNPQYLSVGNSKNLKCYCVSFAQISVCSPFGAFGKLHHNSLPINRESWLESLQDLKQLRCLLLTKHTEMCEFV